MIKFNFQYIRNLASPGVWRRGYAYYQTKQVESVELCEQGIIGKVKGNFRDEYTTILSLSEDSVKSECDCPFPDEWCKHAVAVALIGISEGLWNKFWGIEEVEEEEPEYEGNYKFSFSARSKPKTVVVRVVDRKKNESITQIEPILRSVVEAQKQNIIQLTDIEKREFYLLTFLHKFGQVDKKRKQYYVPYNNLSELMACFSSVEEVRDMHSKQRLSVEKNPLKLIMNVNISMVGNVLVALHWKRTNPEDIIPYEEVRLFAKRVQWGVYDNTFFPIETKVGELPYFLSKNSFLDIRGGDGGKFLFEQLPKFKESLEGELEIEESELVQAARIEVKAPKKVLTLEMPNETTLRAALEFDYDGVRVPYAPAMKGAPYVCVVKGAPEQKQYSVEAFREQEAAQRKADIEAGLIEPDKEKKKLKKVLRIKVLDKGTKGKKPKQVEKTKSEDIEIASEQEVGTELTQEVIPEIVDDIPEFEVPEGSGVVFNNVDFSEYDEFSPQLDDYEEEIDDALYLMQDDNAIEVMNEPEEFAIEEDPEEILEAQSAIIAEEIEEIEEPSILIQPKKKQKVDSANMGSLDSLIDNLVSSSKSNVLSSDFVKKKASAPKRHEVIEDLDLFDKLIQDSEKKPKTPAPKPDEVEEKPKKRRGRPPKKANKDFEPIEETIITNNDDFFEEEELQEDTFEKTQDVTIIEEPKEVYWIKRDIDLERKTFKELSAASLTPVQTNKLEALNDNMIDFVGKFFPHLVENDDWIVEYPEEITRVRIADEPMKFKINIDFGETHANFILDVLCVVGKREVRLDEVQDLLKEGRKYVYAKGAGYAEIPLAGVLQLTKTLSTFDANKIGDSLFRVLTFKVGLIAELFEQTDELVMSPEFQKFWDLIISFSDCAESPIPPSVKADLREYQKRGYTWLHFMYTYGLNGILADDMGLGKTLQSLTLLQRAKDEKGRKPSLVVAPTSVVFNWEDEIKKFTPDLKALNFTGATRHSLLNKFNSNDVIITSYALLRRDIEHLKKYDFRYILLDESQKIKNHQSLTANVSKQLRSNHRLALSGTPIENRLSELWSVFDFLMPTFLYDHKEFKYKYSQPIEEQNNKDAERRLKKQVYPFILRRLKQNVAKDLPDKLEFLSYCEMLPEQQDIYLDVLDYTREEIFRKIERDGFAKSQMSILSALLRLRQICCHPVLIGDVTKAQVRNSGKFEQLKDMIKEVIDQGHRILLFSQFVTMLEIIKEWLVEEGIKHEYLTGATKNRKEAVDRFNNNDNIPIFLISLKAGGTGLNLTGADYVIHYDPWWNPAVEDQATDRAHRIGQTKKVFVYRMITKGTVEEKMVKLQEKKRDLIDSVITVDTSLGKILTYEDLKDILTPDF